MNAEPTNIEDKFAKLSKQVDRFLVELKTSNEPWIKRARTIRDFLEQEKSVTSDHDMVSYGISVWQSLLRGEEIPLTPEGLKHWKDQVDADSVRPEPHPIDRMIRLVDDLKHNGIIQDDLTDLETYAPALVVKRFDWEGYQRAQDVDEENDSEDAVRTFLINWKKNADVFIHHDLPFMKHSMSSEGQRELQSIYNTLTVKKGVKRRRPEEQKPAYPGSIKRFVPEKKSTERKAPGVGAPRRMVSQ